MKIRHILRRLLQAFLLGMFILCLLLYAFDEHKDPRGLTSSVIFAALLLLSAVGEWHSVHWERKHADVDAHEQGRRRNRLAITTLGVVLLGIEVLILMSGMPWVEFLCLLAGTLLALRHVLRKA